MIGPGATIPIDSLTGAVETTEQSSTLPLFLYHLIIEEKTDITLTADAPIDSELLEVSAGHGFTVGKTIVIWEGDRFIQTQIKETAVGGDANKIRIDIPTATPFTIAGAVIVRGKKNLAVDGSGGDIIAEYTPRTGTIPIDIATVQIHIDSTAAGDDGKFGGIAALTNGVYFRKEGNEINFNLGNYKRHRDFKENNFIVDYIPSAKGPSGLESVSIDLDLKKKFTQEIRNSINKADTIKAVIRDNLPGATAINTDISITIGGSYTVGEE